MVAVAVGGFPLAADTAEVRVTEFPGRAGLGAAERVTIVAAPFSRIEILFVTGFAVTMSGFPSPLKSAVAMPLACDPTSNCRMEEPAAVPSASKGSTVTPNPAGAPKFEEL